MRATATSPSPLANPQKGQPGVSTAVPTRPERDNASVLKPLRSKAFCVLKVGVPVCKATWQTSVWDSSCLSSLWACSVPGLRHWGEWSCFHQLCPSIPGTSWSIFPTSSGSRSEAMALQPRSAGEGPVLEEPLGVFCGKAGCTSLLPEHFGFTPLSRPARPSGKWHSLCMSRICLRRG